MRAESERNPVFPHPLIGIASPGEWTRQAGPMLRDLSDRSLPFLAAVAAAPIVALWVII